MCVCVFVGEIGSGDSDCAVECWCGECENSIKGDIMQVKCVMDIFTLFIHMYNIIDGIVGIKCSDYFR